MAKRNERPVKPEGFYKVVDAGGHPPYQTTFKYDLPKRNDDGSWTPGAWAEPWPATREVKEGQEYDHDLWLHVTDDPARYVTSTTTAYRVEVEGGDGAIESPRYGGGHYCKRLRLLHPITAKECSAIRDARDKWNAYGRMRERMAAMRPKAARTRARNEGERVAKLEAGIASDGMRYLDTAMELIRANVTGTNEYRAAVRNAMKFAIAHLPFDVDDDVKRHDLTGYYDHACLAGNKGLARAIEKTTGRKPWMAFQEQDKDRRRLFIGADFLWSGRRWRITRLDAENLRAVSDDYVERNPNETSAHFFGRYHTVTRPAPDADPSTFTIKVTPPDSDDTVAVARPGRHLLSLSRADFATQTNPMDGHKINEVDAAKTKRKRAA